MQPPARRRPGAPRAGIVIVENEHGDDTGTSRGGSCQSGIVGKPKIESEPEYDRSCGHQLDGQYEAMVNERLIRL